MFYSKVIQSVANGVAAGYTTVPLNAVGGVQSVPASGGVVPYEVTLFVAFTPSLQARLMLLTLSQLVLALAKLRTIWWPSCRCR